MLFGKKMFNFKVAVFIFKKSIARASERCGKLRLNRNMYKERKKRRRREIGLGEGKENTYCYNTSAGAAVNL